MTLLKRARIRSGMLQRELAVKANVSAGSLSRYERGWIEPERATAEKIAKSDTRGLSPCEIVSGTIGGKAQSIGCANLPLLANFSQDSRSLFN